MTKLCPRGKAAAKRKFKVYPSAYANAYASKICAGKIKDPSGVKRKDFKGPKPAALGAFIPVVGAIARTAIKKGAQYLAKRKAKKTEKSFFKQLKKEGYESDPAKQTRKNKMSTIVGKARNQKKPELDDKLGAAVGPTYVGSTIVAVKGKEFGDKISEDIASGKRYKKPTTATFMRKSKKYQQKTANFADGGFNKVGMHDVMGSPISVDVDGDNLSNASAQDYYKDLL
tara:strand:- start:2804 stop:3487 length:684 start_codon:yes stop_codon:yes gene_type:complete